ncbi:hypothetical protein BH10PSE14_BH10PSE14_06260 [soil metagenome]
MSSEYRRVEVAVGHRIRARRLRGAADRDGFVVIHNQQRGRLEVPAARWDSAEAYDG